MKTPHPQRSLRRSRFALAGALLAALAAAPGCAWLLGHDRVPASPADWQVVEPEQVAEWGRVRVEASWLGPGERLVSATNAIGRVGRVVNAYGADVRVIHLTLLNDGPAPVVVMPQRATLSVDGRTPPLAPLTLDDYRRRWPAWAATNDEQRADQQFAMKSIFGTMLLERQVRPGEPVEGRLAFPSPPESTRTLVLRLPLRDGARTHEAVFTWSTP